MSGWGVGAANITTAYINDIPGTSVKKSSLASLSLTAFVNSSRGSDTSPSTNARLQLTLMYQGKDPFSQLLNDFLCKQFIGSAEKSLSAAAAVTVECFKTIIFLMLKAE